MANVVWTYAENLLTQAADVLSDAGLPVPDLQFIHHGIAVADCESLLVSIDNIRRGTGEVEELFVRDGRVLTRTAQYTLWLWLDCWPYEVDDDLINAATETLSDYGYALFNGLILRQVNGDLFPGCQNVILSPCTPIAPSGTFAGWQLSVATEI